VIHSQRRGVVVAQDALMVLLPGVVLLLGTPSPWTWLLAAAGVLVLLWNVATLHFPHEVETDREGIRVRAYGREHVYRWNACTVRVRKFVVRDRVLLRVSDAQRNVRRSYWLLGSLSDFSGLLATVSKHQAAP